MMNQDNRRILLIDDNEDIHRDFRKILSAAAPGDATLSDAEDALFGDEEDEAPAAPASNQVEFEIESALQGQEALEIVRRSIDEGQPFAMAFVDMRMPPGWDGIETIKRIWEVDSNVQVVICTAFADYTWTDMVSELGRTDRLLILKKPFDAIEVCQLALAMTEKWNTTRRMHAEMEAVQRAEQEARAYAASLETVNQALEQAKSMAEAAAREHSEFLVSVTGGIIDPMTDLVDRAERIRALEGDDDAWATQLEAVCADGGRLASSLQDVLELAELQAGTLEFTPAPCSPAALAETVCSRYRERAAAKGLELRLDCLPTAPREFEADGRRLERVLEHLVDNAIAYTESGSVVVSVAGAPGVPNRVDFVVLDSGPGLDAEGKARLFQAFCHGREGAQGEQGAGLGLSLSKRLARALGGELEFQSSDTGTRVTFSVTGAVVGVR